MTVNVPLANIRPDIAASRREAIDNATVARYVADIDGMSPADATLSDGTYWIKDGFHRFLACLDAGRTTMPISLEN